MINQTVKRLNNMICNHFEIFSAFFLMICVHVMHMNWKIFMKNSVNRWDKSFDVKFTLYDESMINDDFLKIVSIHILLTLYRTVIHTLFDMKNSCLCLYNMSLKMIMLKICDFVNLLYADFESVYAKLKNNLLYFEDDHLMSFNENEVMINWINQLCADIFKCADVILCTLIAVSDLMLYFYFFSHVIYVNKVNKVTKMKSEMS